MTNQRNLEPEQRLGGGLVLLPSSDGYYPITHNFKFLQRYTLGELAFYVEQQGLVAEALVPLNLVRMENIAQLQFLSTVGVSERFFGNRGPHTFPHNRLIHNLRAGVLHGIIGQSCGLDERELAVGILADCMHDNFTCAGGDSWKDVNHQRTLFDEDDNFALKIWRYCGKGWNWLCAKYGFEPQSTARTIQEIVDGRGLRGEIHEIADTASYMLGDLAEVQLVYRQQPRHNTRDFAEILDAAKRPWDIWNCLVEKDGHIVVTDPIALYNFLMLRVLLWANFYQNPRRKVLEMLMREIVYPHMVSKKLIRLEDLPEKDDVWLLEKVENQMGWQENQSHDLNLLGSPLRMKAYATWNEALAFEEQKYKTNNFTLVFSVKDFQKTNSKTDKYLVFGPNGQADTFKTVYPKHAAAIEEIAQNAMSPRLPVLVVYAAFPRMSDNLRQAWKAARSRWKKKAGK